MALTDLNFCNLAIGKIGGDPIAEMGEDSPLGQFCAEQWPAKRKMLLGKYRWTFANSVRLLSRVELTPGEAAVMPNKFMKPSDMADTVHAFRDRADPYLAERTPYVLLVDNLFWADEAIVYAEYTAARAEALWPGYFLELALYAFAADLAGNAQMRSLQRDYEVKAWGVPSENGLGGLFAAACNEDARMAPPRQLVSGIDDGPLVGSRWGGASMLDRLGIR